jgi:hypothetical protein
MKHASHGIVTNVRNDVGMDIDALHSTLLSITLLSEKLRAVRENHSPSNGARPALADFLEEVERDLRIAKATLASELGFVLCPHCWPPELVAIDLSGLPNCPTCGTIAEAQAA